MPRSVFIWGRRLLPSVSYEYILLCDVHFNYPVLCIYACNQFLCVRRHTVCLNITYIRCRLYLEKSHDVYHNAWCSNHTEKQSTSITFVHTHTHTHTHIYIYICIHYTSSTGWQRCKKRSRPQKELYLFLPTDLIWVYWSKHTCKTIVKGFCCAQFAINVIPTWSLLSLLVLNLLAHTQFTHHVTKMLHNA